MYSVCYVLADGTDFFYYNQMLISLSSLRKREFTGRVFVVMDAETEQLLKQNHRKELEAFGAEIIAVQIPNEYSQKEKSRYIKTSMREYIEGNMLYIDTDTVIADTLPHEVLNSDIALVRDGNTEKSTIYDISYKQEIFKLCGYELMLDYGYFNSGVIWAKDTEASHAFFLQWHKEWKNCRSCGVSQDQPSLNHVNAMLGGRIDELDGKWNVQINSVMSLQYLKESLIIHYFNLSWDKSRVIYMLSNPAVQRGGYRNTDVQKILEAPKEAVLPAIFLRLDGVTEEVFYSKVFFALKKLYANHHFIFRSINYFVYLPTKIKSMLSNRNKNGTK